MSIETTQARHSPAPWRIEYSGDGPDDPNGYWYIVAADGSTLGGGCTVFQGVNVANPADAQLIRAAPEMKARLGCLASLLVGLSGGRAAAAMDPEILGLVQSQLAETSALLRRVNGNSKTGENGK